MRLPVVVFNGLRSLVEVPLLGLGIVSPSLHPDVVCTVALNHSVEWKFGDDVERSVDMESEFLVESFSLLTFSLINIHNIPCLSFAFIVIHNYNGLAFFILS